MSKTAWCTGAGKGIGRAVASKLARQGVHVAVSARSGDDLIALADEARSFGGTIEAFPVDVTDEAAMRETAGRIEDRLGPLDLVILNAGTHIPDSAATFSVESVRTLVETNLMGTVHGLTAVLPRMMERGQGRMAVVSSVAGYRGLPGAAGYGATKAALINLCEALRPELDRAGVDLKLINPGFVRTPLTDRNDFPMPFLMEVDAAAERIVRGLDSNRFEVTFPRRFTWMLKVLRMLPYGLYFAITRRLVRPS